MKRARTFEKLTVIKDKKDPEEIAEPMPAQMPSIQIKFRKGGVRVGSGSLLKRKTIGGAAVSPLK